MDGAPARRQGLGSRSFVAPDAPADVATVIVTYNSAVHVGALLRSIRSDTRDLKVRVIVVDNNSADDTVDIVRREADVVLLESGSNVGYAAAINLAVRAVGKVDGILVLNPDVSVVPGMISGLRAAARRPGVGASVPHINNPDGTTYTSLRREPSLLRAFADALGLHRFAPRACALSEVVREPKTYRSEGLADWATGAVIMLDARCARVVGPWDEQFFLYSEEIDYARRIRAAGLQIAYVPDAVAVHSIGGSGGPPSLAALMSVNRIRYFEKYHGRASALAFRVIVVLHHLLRLSRGRSHRLAAATVLRRSTWANLPGPTHNAR